MLNLEVRHQEVRREAVHLMVQMHPTALAVHLALDLEVLRRTPAKQEMATTSLQVSQTPLDCPQAPHLVSMPQVLAPSPRSCRQ